ncbi:MAG: hypothetical protein JSV92_03030 [archaeon]|nr:MAG: hypothetical protein JSV92_03030 [archaeon]
MDWKGFLKLDWRKIVITIVLLFVLGFMSFFTANCTEFYGPNPIWRCCFLLPIPACEISEINMFFILLVESYILSCLIFWAWDKYRGKKK